MRTHGPVDVRRTSRWRVRSCRVGFVLLLVAIVPLLGVGSVTWTAVQDARAVSDAAVQAEALAQAAVDLTQLDGAVFDEMVWTAVDSFAASIGVSPEQIEQFLGEELGPQRRAAIARTDELLAATGNTEVADAIAAARATDLDMRGVLDVYQTITDSIESSLDDVHEDLERAAEKSSDSDALLGAARNLQLAIATRDAIADQFYGYFATIFDLGDSPNVELSRVITHRAGYLTTLNEVATAASESPELTAGLERIQTDPGLAEFASAVDGLIARSLATGVPATAPALSLDSVVQNLDGFTVIFLTAIAAPDTTSTLLDTTVDRVLSEATNVKLDADANIARSYVLAFGLTVVTLVTAALAGRFIVLPLRRLQRSARDLRDNAELSPLVSVGPTEVRAAAEAIHHAATHLDLVTRQARALACGDLDAEVLDEPAPGGLGSAVQDAVGTLRTALAQQDEFRRRLAHEAAHDGLTKLPNRNASMAQLGRSLARTTRSHSKLAVLFIDLDMFKDVNDQHGHHAGDTVLTTVAQRLVTSVREGDHVGRLGGDEFVVVAEPVDGVGDTVELAQRILETLSEPIDLPHQRVTIGASIGIALADGADLTADELLHDADLAVYRAKAVGRGGIVICDEDLRNELAEAADLSSAIRSAIENDELVMYYQPIVDTRTNQLYALEALVRWQRPGYDTLIPPDRFVAFAERSNLIIDIDRWVIDSVARQVASWNGDPVRSDVLVAVNVSRRHLADDHFVDHVLGPLATYGVDPRRMIIEVTESALLDDLANAAAKLQRLRDEGLLISIDDFGTGYTSLAHLRSLPVDILKIDRSFTVNAATDAHEASIVKLIIDTGHLLGATITAEGIETLREADILTGLGSDNLQGFYFARPQLPEHLVFDHADERLSIAVEPRS